MASTTSDPTNEILLDYNSIFRVYKDGRIVRSAGTEEFAPPGTDPVTNVTTTDVTIDPVKNITARLHVPNVDSSSVEKKKLPILVYFHGGAFCWASAFLPQFQPYLNSVASRAKVLVVSVNYRLATEHLLPAAYEDSLDAIKWLRSSSASNELLAKYGDIDRVFLGGESAGANIVHHMALQAVANNLKIEGAIIIHPFFWGSTPVGSETTDTQKRGFVELLWKVINYPGVDIDHPWINPVSKDAPKLSGFGSKRVLVCIAENDMLVERGRVYVKALKESAWVGDVELFESKGVDHAFYLKGEFGTEKYWELVDKLVTFLVGN